MSHVTLPGLCAQHLEPPAGWHHHHQRTRCKRSTPCTCVPPGNPHERQVRAAQCGITSITSITNITCPTGIIAITGITGITDLPPGARHRRYVSRSDLLEVHQRSEAYITFKKLRKELPFNFVVHGQSYIETNIGFMSRM